MAWDQNEWWASNWNAGNWTGSGPAPNHLNVAFAAPGIDISGTVTPPRQPNRLNVEFKVAGIEVRAKVTYPSSPSQPSYFGGGILEIDSQPIKKKPKLVKEFAPSKIIISGECVVKASVSLVNLIGTVDILHHDIEAEEYVGALLFFEDM